MTSASQEPAFPVWDMLDEEAALGLWSFGLQYLEARQVSPVELLDQVAKRVEYELSEVGFRDEFRQLVKSGLSPGILAVAFLAVRFGGLVSAGFKTWKGTKRDQKRFSSTLLEAAALLEAQFGNNTPAETAFLLKVGFAPPDAIAKSLRMFAKFYNAIHYLSEATGVSNFNEVFTYTLVGLVIRTTSRPHDREVSALLCVLKDSESYDETAHKMWRNRNYAHLDKRLQFIPGILAVWNQQALRMKGNISEQK